MIQVLHQERGPMLKRCLATLVVATAGLVLGACSPSEGGQHVVAPVPHTTPALTPITIRISLAQTRVIAGTSITGEAVLTNTTSKSITFEGCLAHGWPQVGLVNSKITFGGFTMADLCLGTIRLSPGPNRFPFDVMTHYQACVESGGGSPSTNMPPCTTTGAPAFTTTGAPALPAGNYTTKVIANGLPPGTPTPQPISVTLLPAPG